MCTFACACVQDTNLHVVYVRKIVCEYTSMSMCMSACSGASSCVSTCMHMHMYLYVRLCVLVFNSLSLCLTVYSYYGTMVVDIIVCFLFASYFFPKGYSAIMPRVCPCVNSLFIPRYDGG